MIPWLVISTGHVASGPKPHSMPAPTGFLQRTASGVMHDDSFPVPHVHVQHTRTPGRPGYRCPDVLTSLCFRLAHPVLQHILKNMVVEEFVMLHVWRCAGSRQAKSVGLTNGAGGAQAGAAEQERSDMEEATKKIDKALFHAGEEVEAAQNRSPHLPPSRPTPPQSRCLCGTHWIGLWLFHLTPDRHHRYLKF